VDEIRFMARVRYWRPERSAGLAVVDVPPNLVPALGGLKQQRVRGTINGAVFTSSTMPAGGGRLAVSVSKAMMGSAGIGVGTEAQFTVEPPGGS
jgi:hypothetical protein